MGRLHGNSRVAIVGILVYVNSVFVSAVWPQESLDETVDRGYPREWLVCGPFQSTLPDGILGAVGAGSVVLDETDYMEPIGGMEGMRPRHLTRVVRNGAEAVWQRAGVNGPALDLAPFFPEASEGLAFAALYLDSNRARDVLLTVNTGLGARVYLNGFLLRDIRTVPYAIGGVDRFVVPFPRGVSLLVLQIPGARYSALAEVLGEDTDDLKGRSLARRTLLTGSSGFEFAVRFDPLRPVVDSLQVVPRLDSTDLFSGGAMRPALDTRLTLFNDGAERSPAVEVSVEPRGMQPHILQVPPVPPKSAVDIATPVAVGLDSSSGAVAVNVRIDAGGETATFLSNVSVPERPPSGTVYVLASPSIPGSDSRHESRAEWVKEMSNRTALLDSQPNFGLFVDDLTLLQQSLAVDPRALPRLQSSSASGAVGFHAGLTVPDERLVSGELLVRNLLYGRRWAAALGGIPSESYVAWDAGGLSLQTPQLLAKSGVSGVVSNLLDRELLPLFLQTAPDASQAFHRHKNQGAKAYSATQLRKVVSLERRELMESGIDADLYIVDSEDEAARRFLPAASADLSNALPAMPVLGDGADRFFERTADIVSRTSMRVAPGYRSLTRVEPGALLVQGDLKRAFAKTEALALTAEKLATFAGAAGAEYPEREIDWIWRTLLYWSARSQLGYAESRRAYVDALGALQRAAGVAREITDGAASYLAEHVNTVSGAPANAEGAVVVFNPTTWTRTDIAMVELDAGYPQGVTILDQRGDPRPAWTESANGRSRVHFVANDVPGLGYATYVVIAGGGDIGGRPREGVQIENEFLRITVDPDRGGVISQVVRKGDEELIEQTEGNHIIALSEDPDATRGGREVWTTGLRASTEDSQASTNVLSTDLFERLIVTTPFLSGEVVRELTLYRGVPRIDCVTRFDSVNDADTLVAATFGPLPGTAVPVYGERFGAIVGRRSQGVLDFRSDHAMNPSGHGLTPALRFAAVGANDGVAVGRSGVVPFGPAMIVHGKSPLVAAMADELGSALLSRGIPSTVVGDEPPVRGAVYTDSTVFGDWRDDLKLGTVFRIVIGDVDDNLETRRLLNTLGETDAGKQVEASKGGRALLLNDPDIPEKSKPIPTLLLFGATPTESVAVAESFRDAILVNGTFPLAPESVLGIDPAPAPRMGFAVLHDGAMLHSLEADGTLVSALYHDTDWPEDRSNLPELDPAPEFRYSLFPFQGSWRESDIVARGHEVAEPLAAVSVDLRAGILPPTGNVLSLDRPGFSITSVRPAEFGMLDFLAGPVRPRDGILIRGYEYRSTPWFGGMAFFTGIRSAAKTNLLGIEGDSIIVEDAAIEFRANANEIETVRFVPENAPRGAPETLVEDGRERPQWTRYWLHRAGAAPIGGAPVTLTFDGALDDAGSPLRAILSNRWTDKTVRGTVDIVASTGLEVAPASFDFVLEPEAFLSQELAVLTRPAPGTPAALTASAEVDGARVVDIVQTNVEPPELTVRRSPTAIQAEVKNRGPILFEGVVEVVVPSAYWRELYPAKPGFLVESRKPVVVEPFSVGRVEFPIVNGGAIDAESPSWVVVKLSGNGHTAYEPVAPLP